MMEVFAGFTAHTDHEVGRVVDAVTNSMKTGAAVPVGLFVFYGLGVLGTFLGLALFQSGSDYAWDTLAQKVRHDLRVHLYEHLQRLEVAYFEDRQAGDRTRSDSHSENAFRWGTGGPDTASAVCCRRRCSANRVAGSAAPSC